MKTPNLPAIALIAALIAAPACSDEPTEPEAPAEPVPEETRAPLEMVGEYKAFLYGPDHTDPSGNRLTEAWQVLREDRANFHARGVTQADDQTDPLFADPANRERIEEMAANGNLTEGMASKIVDRNVLVRVQLYERDGEPERLDVIVY
ncbi:hypothetical protein AAG612_15090 [Citromicrobium bathyomarinum]|uniref:hypothetical protein n=1 Tax=Citromicrobium bathyomarinum TaxID=72174 RepID=UPI00315AA472